MVKDKLAYIIAVVSEFAAAFKLNPQQAYRYLDRFKGIDFVDKFYNVEHTQPLTMSTSVATRHSQSELCSVLAAPSVRGRGGGSGAVLP